MKNTLPTCVMTVAVALTGAVPAQAAAGIGIAFPEGWDVQRQGGTCQVRLDVPGMNKEPPWIVTLSAPPGAASHWRVGVFNDNFGNLRIPAGTEAFFSVDDRLFATTKLLSEAGTLSATVDVSQPLLTALGSAHAIGMALRSDPAGKAVAVAGFNLHDIPAATAWLRACAQTTGGGG